MTTERTRQDDNAVLLAELQHRVRNNLALMRALVRRSAETSKNLDEYAMHLDGRLDAMARVQSVFLRNPVDGIDLAIMVANELAACCVREAEQITIDGPAVQLQPRAAETIGLALHELATNALKFGALTATSGRIAVTWRIEPQDGDRRLLFDWVEKGVALTDTMPSHRGFGRVVLEEMLIHNLKARTTLSFTPWGLNCRIDLPATERVLKITDG